MNAFTKTEYGHNLLRSKFVFYKKGYIATAIYASDWVSIPKGNTYLFTVDEKYMPVNGSVRVCALYLSPNLRLELLINYDCKVYVYNYGDEINTSSIGYFFVTYIAQ